MDSLGELGSDQGIQQQVIISFLGGDTLGPSCLFNLLGHLAPLFYQPLELISLCCDNDIAETVVNPLLREFGEGGQFPQNVLTLLQETILLIPILQQLAYLIHPLAVTVMHLIGLLDQTTRLFDPLAPLLLFAGAEKLLLQAALLCLQDSLQLQVGLLLCGYNPAQYLLVISLDLPCQLQLLLLTSRVYLLLHVVDADLGLHFLI